MHVYLLLVDIRILVRPVVVVVVVMIRIQIRSDKSVRLVLYFDLHVQCFDHDLHGQRRVW